MAVSSIGPSTKFGPDSEPEKAVTSALFDSTSANSTEPSSVASKVMTATLVPDVGSATLSAPRAGPGSVSSMLAGVPPVKGNEAPLPSVTERFQPPTGSDNPAGIVSAMATSNAPRMPDPVFSTTIANVTVSAPSRPATLESTAWEARAVEFRGPPENRVPADPGADHVIPVGPTCAGVNVADGRLVATTPLVMASSGWVRTTWAMTSVDTVSDGEFIEESRAWLVNANPSAKGSLFATTVMRTSWTVPAVPGAAWWSG